MSFEQYLLVGSYLFTAACWAWAERRFRTLTQNHLSHLRRQLLEHINELRRALGWPAITELPNQDEE